MCHQARFNNPPNQSLKNFHDACSTDFLEDFFEDPLTDCPARSLECYLADALKYALKYATKDFPNHFPQGFLMHPPKDVHNGTDEY